MESSVFKTEVTRNPNHRHLGFHDVTAFKTNVTRNLNRRHLGFHNVTAFKTDQPRNPNRRHLGFNDVIALVFILLSVIATRCHASCGNSPPIMWRPDGRCGRGFKAFSTSGPAECNPGSDRPCCSDYGYCGNSPSHCQCSACVDYRRFEPKGGSASDVTLSTSHAYYFFFKYLAPPIHYYVLTRPSCHFAFEEETGFLESPRYPNPYPVNRDCCYDIRRPSPEFCGVSLQVDRLDVGRGEEEGYCRRDWFSLPSCVPERGARICGNTTGQYFQYLFQPGASAIRFEFHAGNRSESRTGFKIRYKLLRRCRGPYQTQEPPVSIIPGAGGSPCYTRITDSRGTINTPFFPEVYPDDLDCVYEFVRTNSRLCGVKMETVKFAVEDPMTTPFGGACTDFLHLPSCGFLCGQANFSWVAQFQPGATSLKFHFHSDQNQTRPTRPGFLINFEHVAQC